MEGAVTVMPATALEAVTRAEIDLQVATAKQYPRNAKAVLAEAIELATATPEVAAETFYVLQRKDTKTGQMHKIEGGSIRLAEIVAYTAGNMGYGFRTVSDDGRGVIVEGVCIDYERNLRCTKQVRRNVLDRNGRRYSEDMVTMTTMAAGSIACRNAIFGVVPGLVVSQVLRAAKQAALGGARSVAERRDKALAYFAKLGIDEARVLATLPRETRDEVTDEDVQTLLGVATAIRDGVTTVEEAFPAVVPPGTTAPPASAPAEGQTRGDVLAAALAGEGGPQHGE